MIYPIVSGRYRHSHAIVSCQRQVEIKQKNVHVGWFTTALRKREKKTVRKIIIYLNTFQYICTVTNPNPGGKKSTSKKKRLVKLSHLVEKVVKKKTSSSASDLEKKVIYSLLI